MSQVPTPPPPPPSLHAGYLNEISSIRRWGGCGVEWNAEEGELGGSGEPEQDGQDQCTRVVILGHGDVGNAGFSLERAHWQS